MQQHALQWEEQGEEAKGGAGGGRKGEGGKGEGTEVKHGTLDSIG